MPKDFDYYLDLMKSNVSDLDTSEGSVVDGIFRSVAYALAAAQQDLQGVAEIAFPADGSGTFLDARAADVGLTRKPGSKATATVTFSGADGVVIPDGTAVQTAGGLIFRTTEAATIASGSADVAVEAENVGAAYNVPAGEISVLQTATMAMILSSTAAAGGADAETDAALLQRLQDYLRQTPASCNAAQYIAWATSVPGVGYTKVIPRPDGTAYAVKLALVDDDLLPVSQAKAEEVAAFIETVREVNVSVSVSPARSKTINVSASITPTSADTVDGIRERFAEELAVYCRSLAKNGGNVIYRKIEFLLLSIPDVQDLSSLTVNNGTTNISLDPDEVPVVGSVTVEVTS